MECNAESNDELAVFCSRQPGFWIISPVNSPTHTGLLCADTWRRKGAIGAIGGGHR